MMNSTQPSKRTSLLKPSTLVAAATLWVGLGAAYGKTEHPAQAGLAQALGAARDLEVRSVAPGPESVWDQHMFWAPNPDGKTWDVIFFYSPGYNGPHEVYILDTGSGEVKRQEVPRGFAFHLISNEMIDGKLYLKASISGGDGEGPWIYDPATNELTFSGRPMGPDLDATGASWKLIDGMLYGYGHLAKQRKLTVYRLDPKTMKSEVFEPIADTQPDFRWLHSGTYVDGDWMYLRVGQKPWRLFSYNFKTHENHLLVETEREVPDGRTGRFQQLAEGRGWLVTIHRPKGDKRELVRYVVKDGKATEWPENEPVVLHRRSGEEDLLPEKPELLRTPPDPGGNVDLRWRYDREDDWRQAGFKVIRHPMPLRRMAGLADGRIFGIAESYAQAVIMDPEKNERDVLGRTMSVYSMTGHEGLIYMSGYAGGVIWEYDPAKPWTVNEGMAGVGRGAEEAAEDDNLTRPGSNPRQVAKLQDQTEMQNPWGGTVVGADGKVYASGWIIRVGNGGALGWWDPITEQSGGLTDPFSAYPIYWMSGISDDSASNRYLAISTKTCEDDNKPGYTPAQGKIFIFDTLEQKIIREIVPTPVGFHGPVVGAAPGIVMGFSSSPDKEGGMLWAADVMSGELVWTRPLPVAPITNFASVRRNAGTILHPGPDGKIWTFLDSTLVRIAPDDGEVEVVGKVPGGIGQLTFLNGITYIAGANDLRRIDAAR